ncbi:MAG: bifunctional 2-C-methyl-D-erythritol 4-phosphate cytidylyltransferase/2-C-methyl-D-erythritol 2,4-cyclodiphosphate synthase [Micavibrio sp.]|nr:bifunctional 2-C-methyl-D-erythritol 4-phosphate cytidylyltransferase/2-C-methyl-D-erythritol 2,4-cyclodiphosphate synthase [Micavibrio sp.]|tara:strand:+ start:479 stop:1684 length:1206 start_codon:yes stop_codon:yes gene_type:complete
MQQTTTNHPFHLIIVAAGSGSRFDANLPKQYWTLGGKTILRRTVDNFISIAGLQSITIAANPDHTALLTPALHGIKNLNIIDGGKTRKQSVYNALNSLNNVKNEDIILIHDAARPFTEQKDIENLLGALNTSQAATLSHSVVNTLFDTQTGTYPDRDTLRVIQTPQGFHYALLKKAHDQFKNNDTFTDDTSLVMAMGETVQFIDANPHNIKITSKDDYYMAEKLTSLHTITRTGLGFDVHAFDDNYNNGNSADQDGQASAVRLGGIDIPHDRTLKGHSDADVVLHCITDAVLGAMALGDIGDHFPPSDNQYKDMDSMIFLQKARDLIAAKQGVITNIDVTIMCETPKIGSYKQQMQNHIEHALSLPAGSVSIKATTTERLGFTGRKEGIAAQAVATINVTQ